MKTTMIIIIIGIAILAVVTFLGIRSVKPKATITIKDFKHSPAVLTVKPGTVITVVNADIAGHSVTSDTNGIFDTSVIGKDQTATFIAPSAPGTYGYHCSPHPNMTATLVVAQ